MKFVSTPKYNIKLKNWDIDYINTVEKTYDEVLRDIHLQI